MLVRVVKVFGWVGLGGCVGGWLSWSGWLGGGGLEWVGESGCFSFRAGSTMGKKRMNSFYIIINSLWE